MSLNTARGSAPDAAVDALRSWFQVHPVAELDDLRRTLKLATRSVFRVLSRAGYLSSFSHAGRYYTLTGIPRFDGQGLWFQGHVGFSRYGTLRSTLIHLVGRSPAGHTHDELQAIVRLRVHDTLRSLVAAKLIGRELAEALYVYLSATPAVAKAQLAKRHKMLAAAQPPPALPLDIARVIDVLVAVIRQPDAGVSQIAAGLRRRGLPVSDEQVEATLAHYSLEKKTARSASRRSPR